MWQFRHILWQSYFQAAIEDSLETRQHKKQVGQVLIKNRQKTQFQTGQELFLNFFSYCSFKV
jgi:hypothetical protein